MGNQGEPNEGTPNEGTPDEENKTPSNDAKSDEKLGESGLAALKAERKRAADAERDKRALEARLKEFEDRDKSEADKLRDSLTDAQTELADYKKREQIEQWKREVAEIAELSSEVAAALKGSTLEELTEHAELLKTLAPSAQQKAGPYVPNEGKQPTGSMNTKAQTFADLIAPQLS